jgi:acyl-CoA thioester hydrolase
MKEFNWNVRVYYEDTDAGGVVYHGTYLKFMERARTEWLRHLGFSQRNLEEELSLIFAVTKMDIKYRLAARIDEQLTVNARLVKYGGASIDFHQAITNEDNDEICNAAVSIACIDSKTFKPKRMPDILKKEFNNGN